VPILFTQSPASDSRELVQVYLSPFVKAMSPPEAAALRPLLEKKAQLELNLGDPFIWSFNV